MSASNIIGSVFTSEFSFVLAAVPDQPQTVPVLNLEQTSSSQIHIDYPALATSENGGSPILSYELSVYDTDSQVWVSLTGVEDQFSLLNTYVLSKNVIKGKTYQLRYRAWNVNGAGDWSLSGYILAAQVPSRPAIPAYVESD